MSNFKFKKENLRQTILAIVLTLLLTVSFLTVAMPTYAAKITTKAYLAVRPNPIGIGQTLLINAWIQPAPIERGMIYYNYDFVITKADGQILSYTLPESEQAATVWFEIVTDQLGEWTIDFKWDGSDTSKGPSGTYTPAETKVTVTVQKDAVPSPQNVPLPTGTWNYPININNKDWAQISGPWLRDRFDAARGNFNPYSTAPNSPHVLWKLPPNGGIGGLIGGKYAASGYYSKTQITFTTIMAGRGYYTYGGNITCVDIRTGKTLWSRPGAFDTGAMRPGSQAAFTANTPYSNSQPVLYSFGTDRFMIYDALTGAIILNATGISQKGEQSTRLAFFSDPYIYSLTNWTHPLENGVPVSSIFTGKDMHLVKWTTLGTSTNLAPRIVWNITWPADNYYWQPPTVTDGYLTYIVHEQPTDLGTAWVESLITFNDTTGELLYTKPLRGIYNGADASGATEGKFIYQYEVPQTWAAYDIKTGNKLYDTEPADYPWGMFWAYSFHAAYGMFYGLAYNGVYAFDTNTGKIVWHFEDRPSGYATPYPSWPFGSTGAVIADGKIYAPNSEHSATVPYLTGWQLHALDAFNGKQLWAIDGYWTVSAVAEGTLFASNFEDGYSYAFAKGQTATTISVQNDVVSEGSGILIKGSVTDQSPAQFGTPAIADENMQAWMEYLHMQMPKPTNAKGVQVKLSAVDSNGNSQDVGTVTTDTTGSYNFMWTPTNAGTYTIVANFEGTNSYYPSNAQTAVGITTAPAPTSTPESAKTVNQVSAEAFYAVAVVMVVLIIVVAVLFYRKK